MNNKILLQDLAERLSQSAEISAGEAELFVKSFFDIISENVVTDKIVKIKGLGTFKLIDVMSRESINVNTGERFVIPGHSKVSFTPDAELKSKVNKPFELFQTVIINEQTSLDDMERVNGTVKEMPLDAYGNPVGMQERYSEPNDVKDEYVENVSHPRPLYVETQDMTQEERDEAVPVKDEESRPVVAVEEKVAVVPDTAEVKEEKVTPLESDVKGCGPVQCNTFCTPCRWRRCLILHMVFSTLFAILLMLAGYFAGYYRILCPCNDDTEEAVTTTQIREIPVEITKPEAKVDSTDVEKTDSVAVESIEDVKDMSAKYEQVPGGQYLIVGTLKTRQMHKGDNLYKFAKEELGDKNLIQYIIVHNDFSTPDKIPLGHDVKIPQLKKN